MFYASCVLCLSLHAVSANAANYIMSQVKLQVVLYGDSQTCILELL